VQFIDRRKSDPTASFATRRTEVLLSSAAPIRRCCSLLEKSPTNDATRVYAQRNNEDTVLTVSKGLIEPGTPRTKRFRDHHLVSPTGPLAAIEFHALMISPCAARTARGL